MFFKSHYIRSASPLGRCSRARSNMPLKAKILPALQGASQRDLSTSVNMSTDLPEDNPDDVLFNQLYGIRTIELNRPKKLNSLNGSMVRKIIPRLKEWEKSDMANVIIMKGIGPKAFCAGGDVAALAQDNTTGVEGQNRSKQYFALEYQLDHLIGTYSKPYIALMDGITMGGGVGLSVHAPFRIATERTVFAMPETTIGFFPDVGGSFFLPRLDGAIGTYLALTSERLTGVNVFYSGIATHYLHSSSLSDLESRLAELVFPDYMNLHDRNALINTTIEEYSTGLPYDNPMTISGEIRSAIDRCFKHDTVEAILVALQKEKSQWADKTLQTLQERSPIAVRVTLRQMRLGRKWSIAETFQREFHIAGKFMAHPDFTEGVRARLITKPPVTPIWNPKSLSDSSAAMTNEFFELEGEEKLQLLTTGDYHEYPHGWISLPSEWEVEQYTRDRATQEAPPTREDIIDEFVELRSGKQGVKEKVREILERKTIVTAGGECQWIDN